MCEREEVSSWEEGRQLKDLEAAGVSLGSRGVLL